MEESGSIGLAELIEGEKDGFFKVNVLQSEILETTSILGYFHSFI